MKRLFVSLILVLLSGCATQAALEGHYRTVTSGAIGCLPAEIVLSNVDAHKLCPSVSTWIATCKGKDFVCSYLCAVDAAPVTNCKERLK